MYSTWTSDRGVIVGFANDTMEDITEDVVFATSKPLFNKSQVITREYISNCSTWVKSSYEYGGVLKEIGRSWFDKDIISKFLYHAKISNDGVTQYIKLMLFKNDVSDMVE